MIMDILFSAIFEGALLFDAGFPVREMYDLICGAYFDDPETKELFEALKLDWDLPQSKYPLKMIGPFVEREAKNSDFLLCCAFTAAAASTSMLNTFWMSCGYSYTLKKITTSPVEPVDIKLARELFGIFSLDDPFFDYLFSLTNHPTWNRASFQSSSDTVSFREWAAIRASKGRVSRFRCLHAIEKAGERLASPAIVNKSQDLWNTYSIALSSE
jgi:hypothetical protein